MSFPRRQWPNEPLNRLLDALPRAASRRVLAGCEAVELAFGTVLYEPDARIAMSAFRQAGSCR